MQHETAHPSLHALKVSMLKMRDHQGSHGATGGAQNLSPQKALAKLIEPSLLTGHAIIKDCFGGNTNVWACAVCPYTTQHEQVLTGAREALAFVESLRAMVTYPVVNESSTDKIIRELRTHVVALSQQLAVRPTEHHRKSTKPVRKTSRRGDRGDRGNLDGMTTPPRQDRSQRVRKKF